MTVGAGRRGARDAGRAGRWVQAGDGRHGRRRALGGMGAWALGGMGPQARGMGQHRRAGQASGMGHAAQASGMGRAA